MGVIYCYSFNMHESLGSRNLNPDKLANADNRMSMAKNPKDKNEFEDYVGSELRTPEELKIGKDTIGVTDTMPPETLSGQELKQKTNPVFMAPGWLGVPHDFRMLISSLAKEGQRTLSMDALRGIDYKEIFPDIPPEFKDFPKAELRKAAAVIAILEAKGIDKIDVVTYSEGSMYMAMAALLRPDKFTKNMVFVAPAGLLKFKKEGDLLPLHAIHNFTKHYLAHQKLMKAYDKINPPDPETSPEINNERIKHTISTRPGKFVAEAVAQAHYSIDTLMEKLTELGFNISVVTTVEDTLYDSNRLAGDGGTIGQGSTIKKDMVKGVYSIRGGQHGEITKNVTIAVREALKAQAKAA